MALDEILKAIFASGQAQIEEIAARTRAETEARQQAFQSQAREARAQALAEALLPASRERARLLQQARLDAQQIVEDAYEDLIDSVFQRLREDLAATRSRATYPAVLKRLTEEALGELACSLADKEQACLEADPRDRDRLESIVRGLDHPVQVVYTLECWGGVVATSGDGRVVANNTLERRLERAEATLRRLLVSWFQSPLAGETPPLAPADSPAPQ